MIAQSESVAPELPTLHCECPLQSKHLEPSNAANLPRTALWAFQDWPLGRVLDASRLRRSREPDGMAPRTLGAWMILVAGDTSNFDRYLTPMAASIAEYSRATSRASHRPRSQGVAEGCLRGPPVADRA